MSPSTGSAAGTASDPSGIASVRYRVGGGGFRNAAGTWRIVIDLPFDDRDHDRNDDVRRYDDLLARNAQHPSYSEADRWVDTAALVVDPARILADVAHDAHGYRLVRALIDAEDAINAEGLSASALQLDLTDHAMRREMENLFV